MAVTATHDFTIGEWLVQPALNRLSRGGTVFHVRPKLMDLLAFLAARAGGVVPQTELLEAVWSKRFMAESVLTRSIAELREMLGDDAASPRYIETITKRGYRLIAPVEWIDSPGSVIPSAMPVGVRPADPPSPRAIAAGCSVVWGEREILLVEGENIIGREAGAAVRVSSIKVSRRHARIVVAGGRARIEDLGSKNGTYVWGRRIATAELADGDEICVGNDVLIFRFSYPAGTTASDVR